MLLQIKKRLYFVVAAYLGFWARIVLWRWKPRVVVVTGSTGKTTVLSFIEAQLENKAVYSHHANSALGLPFFILGMPSNIEAKYLWPIRLASAPFHIFRSLPKQKLFIAEADCDRPREGKFLSKLLNPEVTLWVSVFRTHSMNFDKAVKAGKFTTHEEAIANEFSYFAKATTKLIVGNGEQLVLVDQLQRVKNEARVVLAKQSLVQDYQIQESSTLFKLQNENIVLPGLHPEEVGINLQMVSELLKYLGEPLDPSYKRLEMPPGRSNVFSGKNDVTIIDSTYNTGLGAMTAIIKLFQRYPAWKKWLVLGDILEQGSLEAEEHEGLAHVIAQSEAAHVVLLGPRTKKHTLPLLKKLKPTLAVESFESPKEVLEYLSKHLKGGETVLFKGGRFLEGVIEQLLEDPKNAKKLVRREPSWVKIRQKWGLPR